jgi:hypothetical protein
MTVDNNTHLQKIDDCRRLYLKYKGLRHERIEREMREMGYTDFHRRILYKRFERGKLSIGWIDRFGWRAMLDEASRKRFEARSQIGVSPRVAFPGPPFSGENGQKSSPPYEGGVAAASARGGFLACGWSTLPQFRPREPPRPRNADTPLLA